MQENSIGSTHPLLALAQEQIQLSQLESALEKSKKAPSVQVGYSNQSFVDINKSRYNSFQVGIGIPLFNKAANSAIAASKVKMDIAQQEMHLQQNKARIRYPIEADQNLQQYNSRF